MLLMLYIVDVTLLQLDILLLVTLLQFIYDGIGTDDCVCYNIPTPTPTPTPSSTPSILCECISLSGSSEAVAW